MATIAAAVTVAAGLVGLNGVALSGLTVAQGLDNQPAITRSIAPAAGVDTGGVEVGGGQPSAAPASPTAAPKVPASMSEPQAITVAETDPPGDATAHQLVAQLRSPAGAWRLPAPLWAAYQQAVARSPRACHLPVALLAAIGQVESGSLAGRAIDHRNRAVPPVYGPLLDGRGVASIHDSDGGRWDGDATWDRAVGPMQFIPGTWAAYGRDGDGDGLADPQDVYDAALSAAGYLCAAGGDLSTGGGLRSAVLAYNHSSTYLTDVLALMASFSGVRTVPAPAPSTSAASAITGTPAPPAPSTTKTTNPAPTTSTTSPASTTTTTSPAPTTTTTSPAPTTTTTSPAPTTTTTAPATTSPAPAKSTTAPATTSPAPAKSTTTTTPAKSTTTPATTTTTPAKSTTNPAPTTPAPARSATSPTSATSSTSPTTLSATTSAPTTASTTSADRSGR